MNVKILGTGCPNCKRLDWSLMAKSSRRAACPAGRSCDASSELERTSRGSAHPCPIRNGRVADHVRIRSESAA